MLDDYTARYRIRMITDGQPISTNAIRVCAICFQAAYANRRYNDMTEVASRNEYQNGTRTVLCLNIKRALKPT